MAEFRDQKAITARITEQMEKAGLDAVLFTSGDAVYYATGFAARDLYRGGQTGNSAALVNKDGSTGLVVGEFALHTAQEAARDYDNVTVTSYPTWIYIEDYAVAGQEKEVQPDLNKTFKKVLEFLPEHSGPVRLGVQTSYLTPFAWEYLTDRFGRENLVDVKDLLVEARAIKTPWEIDVLRTAAHYSELTMNTVARQIVPGMTEADVINLFNKTAFSWDSDIMDVSNAHTIGANFTPSYVAQHTRINRGDIIRLDGGPHVKAYNSDLARTFVVGGGASKDKIELYGHLWAGYEFAREHIAPGVKMSDIFKGIHRVLEERGFTGYVRGHQGHSLGCALFGEEYPFIAPGNDRTFEPGMVMNLEMPYYSSRHQTYNIEDTFLIKEDGVEWFTSASPSLDLY